MTAGEAQTDGACSLRRQPARADARRGAAALDFKTEKDRELTMQKKDFYYEYRTSTVCIDSFNNDVPVGRIYNPYFRGYLPFKCLLQFLRQMESLIAEMHFPRPFFEMRSFDVTPRGFSPYKDAGVPHFGALTTFSITMMFCQNSSWQGNVAWLDRGKDEKFRSVLELLALMDSAMSAAAEQKAAAQGSAPKKAADQKN